MGKHTYPRGKDSGSNCEAQMERKVRQRATDENSMAQTPGYLPSLACGSGEREVSDRAAQWTHQSAVMKSSDWTARNAITWS